MSFSPRADERAALHFADLASALDAGLPLTAIAGDDGAGGRAVDQGDRTLHALLARRGVRLTPTEDAVLAAGWRAGRASAALRGRAREREQRAAWLRKLWAGLRYPLLLLVMLVPATLASVAITGNLYPLWGALAVLAVLGVGLFVTIRGARRGGDRWLRVPLVGPLARDLGELPYLETLHALYGAGVALAQAHPTAVAAVPVAGVQQRLRFADRVVQGGEPLGVGLARSLALHPETRSLLTSGEAAGQLEDALARALARRRDIADRGMANAARWFGHVVYGLAILGVLAVVLNFVIAYDNLFAKLH